MRDKLHMRVTRDFLIRQTISKRRPSLSARHAWAVEGQIVDVSKPSGLRRAQLLERLSERCRTRPPHQAQRLLPGTIKPLHNGLASSRMWHSRYPQSLGPHCSSTSRYDHFQFLFSVRSRWSNNRRVRSPKSKLSPQLKAHRNGSLTTLRATMRYTPARPIRLTVRNAKDASLRKRASLIFWLRRQLRPARSLKL